MKGCVLACGYLFVYDIAYLVFKGIAEPEINHMNLGVIRFSSYAEIIRLNVIKDQSLAMDELKDGHYLVCNHKSSFKTEGPLAFF